jgi:hypothetical protein
MAKACICVMINMYRTEIAGSRRAYEYILGRPGSHVTMISRQ